MLGSEYNRGGCVGFFGSLGGEVKVRFGRMERTELMVKVEVFKRMNKWMDGWKSEIWINGSLLNGWMRMGFWNFVYYLSILLYF